MSVFALLLFANAEGVPYRLIPWDFRSLTAPWLIYGWDLIRSGFLPLWCPYAGAGVPFFINPQTSLYSPLSLILGPLLGYSYRLAQVHTVLMLLIGGIGAYALSCSIWKSRSGALISGLCFELSSTLFGHMEHLTILAAYALTPWIFWSVLIAEERRSPWGLPLVAWFVYWLITAGYIGLILILVPWTVAFAIALVLKQPIPPVQRARAFAATALAALLGCGMAALNWLPFVLHTTEFTRGKPLSIEVALSPSFSLSPKDFWGMLWSFFMQYPLSGTTLDISMRGLYFGAVAVVLAVVCIALGRGWIVRALITLAVGSLLMTFGGAFFGRVLLHILVPLCNSSRLPAADSSGLVILALCILAGGGAVLIVDRATAAHQMACRAFKYLFLFYIVGMVALPLINGKMIEAQLATVTFEAICMALALLVLERVDGARVVVLLAGIAWLETGYCAMKNFEPIGQPVSPADYAAITRHVSTFTVDNVNSPRLGDGANPVDQSSAEAFVAKKFHINDYNPLRLNRFDSLIATGFLPWMQKGPRVMALAVGALPPSFAEFVASATPVPFSILEYTPNRVRYHVDAPGDALLVFNEIYFPGWKASVDGKPGTVMPLANGLRSLTVKGGSHELDFTFRPMSYFVALGIALAAFVTFISWIVLVRRRTRRAFELPCPW